MSTTISRSGVFDAGKLGVLDNQLTQALGIRCQVYGSPTGFYVFWQQTLSAPQNTQATQIINAYTEPTDQSRFNNLERGLFQFLQISTPTNAQVVAAVRALAKLRLRDTLGKDSVDGQDIGQ